MEIVEFLQNSLKGSNEKELCRGWDYLKSNAPASLMAILEREEYWGLAYNSQKEDFIIEELGLALVEGERKQLGSFVYLMNQKRREEAKQKEEQGILSKGYVKIFGFDKSFDGKNVRGIFNLSMIGCLGSFDKLTEKEGKLVWAERFNNLMLIPKRSRTKGFLIRDFAYIKMEGGNLNG